MANRPPENQQKVHPSWQPIAAIVAVAVIACIAGIGNEFAQDDIYLIRDNATVHSLANVGAMFRTPFWPRPFSPDLYRPLTSMLLAVEYQVGVSLPTIFRVVSDALYAAVAVNVFLLARTFAPAAFALGAALLFAAHPVHVEAVALGVGQSELAVGLIALLMVRRYLAAREVGPVTLRGWFALGALYVAASLFKEQGLVLPALLIAGELFLVRDVNRGRWLALAKGIAGLTAAGVVVLLARRAVVGDVSGTFVAEALVGVPIGGRFLTMLRVAIAWLRLLAWPAHLQTDYSPQEIVASTTFGPIEAAGALALGAIVISAWLLRRRAPAYAFAVAWCAIALFPVSNVLVPTGIVLAERTMFLPSIGFVLGVAAIAAWVVERTASAPPASSRVASVLSTGCAALVVLGLARSVARQRDWRDDAFLAARTVQDAPNSFRAQRVFGDVAFDVQQPRLGAAAYARALALAPDAQRWRVHNDIARSFRRMDQPRIEAEHLRASLAQQPTQEDTRGYLIAADLALGAYADARRQADSAIALGAPPAVFAALGRLADSAATAGAPAGSVRIAINTGAVRRGP